jgi:hypothetical protein
VVGELEVPELESEIAPADELTSEPAD